jgi:antagonist of KipI
MPQISLTVIEGGLQSTLQDLGRVTGRRYGIPPGGALDRAAHLAANQLVFNQPQAATLEITLKGPRLYFETPALIAITGADFGPRLNQRPVPLWMSLFVRAGQTLDFSRPSPLLNPEFRVQSSESRVGNTQSSVLSPQSSALSNRQSHWGRVCYLSIHGGFTAPAFLGSRATYLKAKLSGYKGEGRVIADGDVLENSQETDRPLRHMAEGAGRSFPEAQRPAYQEAIQVRIVRGPYDDHFSPEAYQLLFNSEFQLMAESDRMGFRLNGPRLVHRRPQLADIDSCAAVFGAIQVPSNGQPIVLMADHQVTGGYPIIGTVLSADLPLLAQLLPGGKISFIETSI